MKKRKKSPIPYFEKIAHGLNSQAVYQEELLQSAAMSEYVTTIEANSETLRNAIANGDFDELMTVEMTIQQIELERFAHDADMMKSIQKTQRDLAEGMKDYKQLRENPAAYRARGYREQDLAGSNKKYPVDTMRKALRGQAARIGNFARNPMLFPVEKEFHQLRVTLLRRAEQLYEDMQKEAMDG